MWKFIFVIVFGVVLGVLLCWFFGFKLNSLLFSIFFGMLLVNLVGGYVIGVVIVYFVQVLGIVLEWWLLIIIGFCGGLIIFFIFFVEVVSLFQEGCLGWVVGVIVMYVSGLLLMILLGLFLMNWMLGKQCSGRIDYVRLLIDFYYLVGVLLLGLVDL